MPRYPEIVWLCRHAETATPGVFHGAESDVALSQLGQTQALALAEHFATLRPTVVVSSAMQRAVNTATPIARRLQLPHHIEPEFHERKVGMLSGTDFTASSGLWADTIQHWTSGNTAFRTEGAESFDEIRDRVMAAWELTLSRFEGERVVIVAHGVVCKVLVLTLLPQFTPANWQALGPIANCAVTGFEWVHSAWNATPLLQVPAEVLALNQGQPTGIGTQRLPQNT